MEGSLFNPGFLGSKFSWWIGQVADDTTWRENQNPAKVVDPKSETPAWGYRYKVRIMGIHDKTEESIESDRLPWAQVMYSVWGGGQAGSYQTPGIRQGMFVFGFFLDGSDAQVPVIMGILGSNAKTTVENLKTGKDPGGESFGPQSGWANSDNDETKKVPDWQIATAEPSSVATKECTDCVHQEAVDDKAKDRKLEQKHSLACPDPEHQSDTLNIQTEMEECSKKIRELQEAQQEYAKAVSLPVNEIGTDVQKIIDDTTGKVTGPMKGIMNQAQQFTIDEHNKKMQPIFNLAVPSFKNQLLEENIKSLEEICCMFNALNAGLAGLIGGAIGNSFKRKKKQRQSRAVQNANAAAGVQPELDTPAGVEIPPLPPKGYYSPNPICSTEELMGEVLGSMINTITQGFADSISGPISSANNSLVQGGSSDGNSISGSAPTRSLDTSISQSNVTASLKDGALVGGIAGALAAAAGVDVNLIGSVSNAFRSGNYGSGLASMLSLAGVTPDSGIATAALNAIDGGDLVGGFIEAGSALGVPPGMMAGIGGAFGAIQSGDMSALTGQIQSLASFAPDDMLGAISGLGVGDLMGGSGALGGMGMDMASAMNFVQTITKMFECDPEVECSPNDEHTLGSGGAGAANEPNVASIAESANNAAKGS